MDRDGIGQHHFIKIARVVIYHPVFEFGRYSGRTWEPLGEEEVRLTKKNLKWPYEEPFTISPEVLTYFRRARSRGKLKQREWEIQLAAYSQVYPQEARQLREDLEGNLPVGWDDDLPAILNRQIAQLRHAKPLV